MKLIAIYSVFDGEELLEFSIKSIKNCVDFVYVIYQTTSNFGIFNENLENKIIELKDKKLIDECFHYSPLFGNPSISEINKRNLGLDFARKMNFTHFMTIDCDEFYFEKQFNDAKKYIIDNNIDSSVCHIQNYHKNPEYRVIGKSEPFKVPFINKINEKTNLVLGGRYFTDMIDPTRITNTYDNNVLFDESFILMHHYTTIRKDIRRKYESWTCRVNYSSLSVIDERANKVLNYDIEKDEPKCEIVNNYFNIKL
jgi:hypothetical protein